jgi:nucleoside 2-deoxyribosyltransferase
MYNLYLAHPFNSRDDIRVWQKEIEDRFTLKLINPFSFADSLEVFQAGDVNSKEYYEKINNPRAVVERDFKLIDQADGLLAIVSEFSPGTLMELCYAHHKGKVTYTICTNGHEKHPFIMYHSTLLFPSFGQFHTFLEEISI